MTHDELLAICDNYSFKDSTEPVKALRAVVELTDCVLDTESWQDDAEYNNGYMNAMHDVFQAIEKELG